MILVQDNYLPEGEFKRLQDYCEAHQFQIVQAGDKEFSVLPTPEFIEPHIQIEGHQLILTFIRRAYPGFDEELRIHADGYIQDRKAALATVLYLNNEDDIEQNGTRFHNHKAHGHKMPEYFRREEFDYLLKNESNDPTKWTETDRITAKPNRILTYDSDYFHSKFPSKIEKGVRMVLVAFYEKI